MIRISTMAGNVQASATLAAAAKAKQLKAEGKKVFDFSLGEPDFPTPAHICDAAVKAMRDGQTKYTAASGTLELRGSIARWYEKFYGIQYAPEQIIVSNGAKHSISTALASVLDPGDEVIIPAPYWVSYSDLVQMCGATSVVVPTTLASGFKMSADQLRAKITPRTRLLMLNSPSNPTGTVYTRAELMELAAVVLEHKITVLSDEIYERLIFGDARATCFATLLPGLADLTLTISGASKTFSMTGWRIGWTLGPKHVIAAMGNVQSQQTSSPCSISQAAARAALEGEQGCVETMRQEFAARRDLVCGRLAKMPGVKIRVPEGAFYAFFDVSGWSGKQLAGEMVKNSNDFCRIALEKAHVCMVQGSAFGAEDHVRLSFASSREELQGGLDRLEALLQGGF